METYLIFHLDLVPASVVAGWLKHLRNEFPTIAFKASTQTQKQHLVSTRIMKLLNTGCPKKRCNSYVPDFCTANHYYMGIEKSKLRDEF